MESWVSGRNHVPAKDANPKRVPRVQISHSPPKSTRAEPTAGAVFSFCYSSQRILQGDIDHFHKK